MATGYWISQAIYVAAKLGITDMLKDEPQSCVALAAATGSDAPSLFRLMRASASVGVFSRVCEIPSLFPASQRASRLILLHLLGRLGRW
jgi:Dimerisation domain